jgi:2-phosphosulfolactate phosphatase
MIADQAGFDLRCEWGRGATAILQGGCDAAVIVDVLSFSTTVDVAASRGAAVYPFAWKDASAAAFAARLGASLAGSRGECGYSLSPASLLAAPSGLRLVLPSPNGATLSLLTGECATFAGCLRNARAVARAALGCGPRVAVIAAGERWPDGSLRPALEDWIGAGAILHHLKGSLSPEAGAALAAYRMVEPDLSAAIAATGSGTELISAGYSRDVELACEAGASGCVPRLIDRAYRDVSGGGTGGRS